MSGRLTDVLLSRGDLKARVWVPAVCYLGAAALLALGFLGSRLTPALWFDVGGAALIAAANPPLDAARLDIMPAGLWGRAESVFTVVRSLAQAFAPVLFGALADFIAGIAPKPSPIGTHPRLGIAHHRHRAPADLPDHARGVCARGRVPAPRPRDLSHRRRDRRRLRPWAVRPPRRPPRRPARRLERRALRVRGEALRELLQAAGVPTLSGCSCTAAGACRRRPPAGSRARRRRSLQAARPASARPRR